MNGKISRVWANGRDDFCLAAVASLLDLEDRCKAGLATIAARLESGNWYVNDLRDTIRIGLIGGGMSPDQAQRVVDRHVVPPLAPFVLLAYEIIASAMVAPADEEQPGKAQADRTAPEFASSERTGDSPDSPSTSSAPNSDGTRATSTASPSGSSPSMSTATTPPTQNRKPPRRNRPTTTASPA